MNQCSKIEDYMRKFGSISTMEAFRDLGITRLGARIMELERQGLPIERKYESALNRFGEKTHYTRYAIADREQ